MGRYKFGDVHVPGETVETSVWNIELSPWLRAMVLYDEFDHYGVSQSTAVVNDVLMDHYMTVVENPERERMERLSYAFRDSGMSWVAVARRLGIPYQPIKAQLLAMCYAFRPTLVGRAPLPWPI